MYLQPHNESRVSRLLPDTATFSSEGVLHIACHPVPELARVYGTPLYIFDRTTIINACIGYKQAFRAHYHASAARILYASKAYLSPLIARLMSEQGIGLDVVSGGELLAAQRVNFPMQDASFHGNNKSEHELRLALRFGVGRIVLDNWSELERLIGIVQGTAQRPGVLLRVAPGVDTDTHRYLQTGHAASKFGFPLDNGEAKAAITRILHEDQLRLLGLHAHSGTMLREARPYQETLERLLALARAVYRVGARKPTPGGITYLFVDGGMADNIRPALYAAHYTALALERAFAPPEENVCVAGRYCESGDVLIESVTLPRMREGELLALPTAGAYCLPMASNYNLVPRPAVLLVDEQQVEIMERRETYDDLLLRYQTF